MPRIAAGVEYDGSAYAGWQAQPGVASVQATLQAALSRVAASAVRVHAAGRTDAGVHALGQVVHFETEARRDPYSWLLGTNSNLPPSVSLRWVQAVDSRFHARFSATGRWYRYLMHNHRARSALLARRAARAPLPLDHTAMHRAAQCLLGEHDFSAFRAAECQSRSPYREVREISVWRAGDLVVLDVRANAFLHHMVRNIAGALIAIGSGERAEEWLPALLAGRDRRRAPATAPAEGLYLVAVEYPDTFGLPPPPIPWFPAGR